MSIARRPAAAAAEWAADVLASPAVEITNLLLPALGLAMFLEGLPYFIAPSALRSYLRQLEKMSDGALRVMGFTLMAAGLLLAYVTTR